MRLKTTDFFPLLLLLFSFPGVAVAESFRQVGDELLEVVVMESDAILEAEVVTIGNARVKSVLMDVGTLSSDISHGALISRLNMPSYSVPLFDGIGPEAKLLERPDSETTAEYPERLLLFIQENKAQTIKRFGFPAQEFESGETASATNTKTSGANLKPYFSFGKYGYYFYGNIGDQSRQDKTWGRTIFVVQDFEASEESLAILAEQSRAVLSVVSPSQPAVKLFPVRRIPVAEQERSWSALLSRLGKSIQKRRQFFRAEHYLAGAEQVEVLLKLILDENIYSNYALEAISKLDRKEIDARLREILPRLLIFLDDTVQVLIDRKLRRIEPTGIKKLQEYVTRAKNQVASQCRSGAGVGKHVEAIFIPNEKNLFPAGDMLLVSFAELRPLLEQLYQAELQCFLKRKGLGEEHLQIDYERRIGSDGRELLRSGSLTRDEIGLLETKINVSLEQFEKQQTLLRDFQPVLTNGFFDQLRFVPWRLYELIDYCEQGIVDYDSIALPDYRRATFVLWNKACRELSSYLYPRNKCDISDSRLRARRDQFRRLVETGLNEALEHDDSQLLQLLLSILRKNRTPEGGMILTNVLKKSKSLRGEKLRQHFIAELSDWPFYPLAYALAQEYSEVPAGNRVVIEKTLEKLSGYSFRDESKLADGTKWMRFLEKGSVRGESTEEKALGSAEAIRLSRESGACDEQNHGWNQRLREVASKL